MKYLAPHDQRDRHWLMRTVGLIRKNALACIAVLVLGVFAVITFFGEHFAPYSPGSQNLSTRLVPPGGVSDVGLHVLGTDALGRDMLSLVLGGAQSIVTQALFAVVLGAGVGMVLGLICGYKGGRFGDALLILTNLQLSFPFFLLAIVVVGILGASYWLVVVVVALASWVEIARVVYAETRTVAQLEYVQAVHVMRGSDLRAIFRHILPNVLPSVLVLGALAFGTAIVIISGLGFIGLAAPSPSPSWGQVLSDGRDYMGSAWWLTVVPGGAIFLLVFAVNIVGESVRDAIDPNLDANVNLKGVK